MLSMHLLTNYFICNIFLSHENTRKPMRGAVTLRRNEKPVTPGLTRGPPSLSTMVMGSRIKSGMTSLEIAVF